MATDCRQCLNPLSEERLRRHARFCSDDCSNAHRRERYRAANPGLTTPLSSGTTGAIAELAVATDLMSRGYDVFRALSPNCSSDLAVVHGATFHRVEVRSGKRSTTGALYYPRPARDIGRLDVYAVVIHAEPRQIIYLTADGGPHPLF